MALFLSACAKNDLQHNPDIVAGKLFSIPTFDGVPTNADIFIKEKKKAPELEGWCCFQRYCHSRKMRKSV